VLLSCPIRTPTPKAISNVATPATNVAALDIRGRWGGRGAAAAAAGSLAATAVTGKRGFPRRWPQFRQ
jgi:hypothetical protein